MSGKMGPRNPERGKELYGQGSGWDRGSGKQIGQEGFVSSWP